MDLRTRVQHAWDDLPYIMAQKQHLNFPYINLQTASGLYNTIDRRKDFEPEALRGSEQWKKEYKRKIESSRRNVAGLLNAHEARIGFTHNTTEALDIALRNLDLNGEKVVTTNKEYGSINRLVENQAGTVQYVNGTTVSDITRAVDSETGAVLVSHVTHDTGEVLPVEKIVQDTGDIPCVVDAAQSVGHLPVDVQEISADVLVSSGHKWLRGGIAGFLYARDTSLFTGLTLLHPWGLHPRIRDSNVSKSSFRYNGPGNAKNIVSVGHAIAVQQKYGWENVFDRTQRLGNYTRDQLSSLEFVQLPGYDSPSPGMIPLRIEGMENEAVQKRLLGKHNVNTTYKKERDIIRVSTSAFNTHGEIDYLRDVLVDVYDDEHSYSVT